MADHPSQKKLKSLEDLLGKKDESIRFYKREISEANTALKKVLKDLALETKYALAIQKKLSPTTIPQFPDFHISTKFIAGTDTGGDYFDFFQGPNKMVCGIVLSSSSGYSLSALFLSVLIKLSGFLQTKKAAQPDQALKVVADEMLPQLQAKDESHLAFLSFDRRSFEVSIAHLGRILCFHRLAKTKKIELIPSAGPALCAGSHPQFLQKKLNLDAGDVLVLLSPPFEISEKLMKKFVSLQVSSAHELRNEIIYQLEREQKSADFKKDITLVVLEVKDRVIKLAK